MTSIDLVSIIKACGEAGVVEIKLGDIYINFVDSSHKSVDNVIIDDTPNQSPHTVFSAHEDDELISLQLSDPLLYEERMLKSEEV